VFGVQVEPFTYIKWILAWVCPLVSAGYVYVFDHRRTEIPVAVRTNPTANVLAKRVILCAQLAALSAFVNSSLALVAVKSWWPGTCECLFFMFVGSYKISKTFMELHLLLKARGVQYTKRWSFSQLIVLAIMPVSLVSTIFISVDYTSIDSVDPTGCRAGSSKAVFAVPAFDFCITGVCLLMLRRAIKSAPVQTLRQIHRRVIRYNTKFFILSLGWSGLIWVLMVLHTKDERWNFPPPLLPISLCVDMLYLERTQLIVVVMEVDNPIEGREPLLRLECLQFERLPEGRIMPMTHYEVDRSPIYDGDLDPADATHSDPHSLVPPRNRANCKQSASSSPPPSSSPSSSCSSS
jgi:hypothetical protein